MSDKNESKMTTYKLRTNEMNRIRVVLFSDEKIYEILYQFFKNLNENTEEENFNFVADNYNVVWYTSRKNINKVLNPLRLQGITHVIIQKSFYLNKDIERYIMMMNILRPNIKFIVLMDVPLDYYSLFLHHLYVIKDVEVAMNPSQINDIFHDRHGVELEQFHLKKVKRKQRKEYYEL